MNRELSLRMKAIELEALKQEFIEHLQRLVETQVQTTYELKQQLDDAAFRKVYKRVWSTCKRVELGFIKTSLLMDDGLATNTMFEEDLKNGVYFEQLVRIVNDNISILQTPGEQHIKTEYFYEIDDNIEYATLQIVHKIRIDYEYKQLKDDVKIHLYSGKLMSIENTNFNKSMQEDVKFLEQTIH